MGNSLRAIERVVVVACIQGDQYEAMGEIELGYIFLKRFAKYA